jgi:elongation factor P
VELKNLRNNTKLNERFRSADKVEKVRLDQKDQQFLYENDGMLVFMDMETYDQIALGEDMVEAAKPYMLPEMEVEVEFHEDRPLNVKLPQSVNLVVTECDASIKGQTATSSYKPGVLETGAPIMVPPYLEAGTKVRVNTETGEYMERA